MAVCGNSGQYGTLPLLLTYITNLFQNVEAHRKVKLVGAPFRDSCPTTEEQEKDPAAIVNYSGVDIFEGFFRHNFYQSVQRPTFQRLPSQHVSIYATFDFCPILVPSNIEQQNTSKYVANSLFSLLLATFEACRSLCEMIFLKYWWNNSTTGPRRVGISPLDHGGDSRPKILNTDVHRA